MAFVGPLPPPVNGFSNVCAAMLINFSKVSDVRVFDRSPCSRGLICTLFQQLIRPLRYLMTCITRSDVTLYIALSGGIGQAIDGLYVTVAKIFANEVIVHHHSSRYIIAPSFLNRVIFSLVRKETHIVLSQGMGVKLANIYGVGKIEVVSNAAMYSGVYQVRSSFNVDGPIRLGFISNITVDKGIIEFFEVLEKLRLFGIEYQAHIAGPVETPVRGVFEKLLSSSPNTVYEGPVYGEAKAKFYQQLDVLLFPTKYANEAEPLVIHEALQNGVYVLATDRGAIGEMLTHGAGHAWSEGEFVDATVTHIRELSGDRDALLRCQRLAFEHAGRMFSTATGKLQNLMEGIGVGHG